MSDNSNVTAAVDSASTDPRSGAILMMDSAVRHRDSRTERAVTSMGKIIVVRGFGGRSQLVCPTEHNTTPGNDEEVRPP